MTKNVCPAVYFPVEEKCVGPYAWDYYSEAAVSPQLRALLRAIITMLMVASTKLFTSILPVSSYHSYAAFYHFVSLS